MVVVFLWVGCVEKEGASASVDNPLSECVIPQSVHAGGEGVIQWNGFNADDVLCLVSSDGSTHTLVVETVTPSGLIFRVPALVPAGTYLMVLERAVRKELGDIEVLAPEMPVTGVKVPSAVLPGDVMVISGLGFETGCRVVLDGMEGALVLDAALTADGISVELPEDLTLGTYSVYLEQGGLKWLLGETLEVYDIASEKTLRYIRYRTPYVGTSEIMVEWDIFATDSRALILSEYLVEGDEPELLCYDRYVSDDAGTFVLDHDGRESSNDIEMSYVRDSDGTVRQTDVLIYGKSKTTPFAWTYDADGNLTEIESPSVSFRSYGYDAGNLTVFRQTVFEYEESHLVNNPSAADVIWGYMSLKEPDDPFVYVPYLAGWYSPKSVALPSGMSIPSSDGSGMDSCDFSYMFDDEGYVTMMSWQAGGSLYSVEFVYE